MWCRWLTAMRWRLTKQRRPLGRPGPDGCARAWFGRLPSFSMMQRLRISSRSRLAGHKSRFARRGGGYAPARRVYNAAAPTMCGRWPSSSCARRLLRLFTWLVLAAAISPEPGGGRGAQALPGLRRWRQSRLRRSRPCSAMLSTLPFYDRYYAHNLRRQVEQHQAHFPHLPRLASQRLTMRLSTTCNRAARRFRGCHGLLSPRLRAAQNSAY